MNSNKMKKRRNSTTNGSTSWLAVNKESENTTN
jgi:hypothetical protein